MRNFFVEGDPIEVSAAIEQIVKNNGKYLRNQKSPYMTAILEYCEQRSMDFERVSGLLSEAIKQKLRLEAEDLHYLPKISRLPV